MLRGELCVRLFFIRTAEDAKDAPEKRAKFQQDGYSSKGLDGMI
jgi:hypothetical protein